MRLSVQGISSEYVNAIRMGALDANGQVALERIADGPANPCRHCLQLIAEGEVKLVLAYRPFDLLQPYAELGPIFLHKKVCQQFSSNSFPDWFQFLQPALVRGYTEEHWICYETGEVVPGKEIENACRKILSNSSIAYVHVRSRYNCFQCRVERTELGSPGSPPCDGR